MTKKIFRSIFLTAVLVLCVSFSVVFVSLYSYFGQEQSQRLHGELLLAAQGVEQGGEGYLQTLPEGKDRLTWISPDGEVLYDSEVSADSMENHADREEVQQALTYGAGQSVRVSETLTQETVYEAKKLQDGSVLRISGAQVTPLALILWMFQPILLMLLVATALSAFLAGRMAQQITEPLNRLDLDHPMAEPCYDELLPLLRKIQKQGQQIDRQVHQLQEKTEEFTQITDNMAEGLVLLNEKGRVLSINPAARTIFHAEESCIDREFLLLDRSKSMSQVIEQALATGRGELQEERDGRRYQFDVNRIQTGEQVTGAVILAFDVTERSQAERSRREFTANVSHEMKTPLQSILGSAELLEQGLVSTEDVPRFVGHIRTEATRLLALIQDILRLSQLDEGGTFPQEQVELQTLVQEVARELDERALARKVTLHVSGESVNIQGVRALLHEIVYNLCDNAIKYNVPQGKVELSTARQGDMAVVQVKDTGIGIPPEDRERVFERFFRVDKSRSKERGGTGLGLSIVKHAVQYHGGKLDLVSREHEGTTITVTLPMEHTVQ